MDRGIPCLSPSLDAHVPKNKFKAKKCIQNISKKISSLNNAYRSSRLKYVLKKFMKDISSINDW